MQTSSTIEPLTEVISYILKTTSEILTYILGSPIGSILSGLFIFSIMLKLFRLLFFGGGYSLSSDYEFKNDVAEDTEDIEEEIILNDDLIQQELKCHNCGAKLNLKKVKNSIIECEYCNTQYLIKNEE